MSDKKTFSAVVFIRLQPFGNLFLSKPPKLFHLGMMEKLVRQRLRPTTDIQCSGTFARFFIQQQADGCSSSLTRRTNERTEKNIRQRIEPHVHGNNICRNNARIGSINDNPPLPDTGSQFQRKESQSQFRITINRDTPEAPFPSAQEKSGKSSLPMAYVQETIFTIRLPAPISGKSLRVSR